MASCFRNHVFKLSSKASQHNTKNQSHNNLVNLTDVNLLVVYLLDNYSENMRSQNALGFPSNIFSLLQCQMLQILDGLYKSGMLTKYSARLCLRTSRYVTYIGYMSGGAKS